MQTWMQIFSGASSRQRKRIVDSVLDGMSYFNAKWSRVKTNPIENSTSGTVNVPEGAKLPPEYELKSKDQAVEKLVKDLIREKGLKLVGVIPEVNYMKVTGSADHLDALWNHPFGAPTLLYAHETLPILIVAGASIMYNDSIVRNIAANGLRDKLMGISG